ncbi:potassium transporter Kup [Bradyrhizobium sp. CCBAU 51627]|uniref:potassium transporter Kup n=1 Tax=Bradyrhizobium sp. CCBAU 51627 TaxID=1325088 RepID=UPI002306B7DE|nr:potassium transporter Kup [Bradyrhizobium sp. CCBAU 51627]MDA9430707.1 potassium transport protein Kup [Bradyrhizobium sp. CCBAU 51627]
MTSDVVGPAPETAAANGHGDAHTTAGFGALTLGSIGVVYGDIGTSPLYALREAVVAASGAGNVPTTAAVLGVLSLILWALIVVVTLKYVVILLRADNNGEGGTLALMALAQRAVGKGGAIVLLGIISGALFYGDAVITPALSVLSAVEGTKDLTESFEPYIVPLTILILVALFAAQSRGTARVAAFFGPITCIWFAAIAVAAIGPILNQPHVLLALNPLYAVSFMLHHGIIGFVTLGAVFLAVTGAEALYADLGHFGKRPIQAAWLFIVLPSLALNYIGQAALVIADPKAIESPFFQLYPQGWIRGGMVLLATIATVIASQAVITGAYSLTRQAIQLGLLPRFEIRHTSEAHSGQIFMPRINQLLLVAVVLLVLLFRSSSALASAYGISVTGTMVVTAMMGFVVIWKVWRWSPIAAAALIAPFLFLDLTFLAANLLKVFEGGWVPLALGALMIILMYTWRRGSRLLFEKSRKLEFPLADLVAMLEKRPPQRVPGTAVFLTSDPLSAPTALMHSLKHYKVLHEKNVILTIETAQTPRIDPAERVKLEQVSPTFSKVTLKFGFMESPNVPKALAIARKLGWQFDIMSTSFFLSRRALKPAAHSGMPRWQDRLFISLSRSANDATDYFQIPSGRVVEVGTQVTI